MYTECSIDCLYKQKFTLNYIFYSLPLHYFKYYFNYYLWRLFKATPVEEFRLLLNLNTL